MYSILIKIHVWSSILFTLVAIALIFFAIKGLIYKGEYKTKHLYLENSYIGLLYLGLILGVIMYFFVSADIEPGQVTIEQIMKQRNSQFWAIEHFSTMIFALLLAQIGRVFTSKAITSLQKFKYSLFYYGSASCIVLISMIAYLTLGNKVN